jgi:hypothetical protein
MEAFGRHDSTLTRKVSLSWNVLKGLTHNWKDSVASTNLSEYGDVFDAAIIESCDQAARAMTAQPIEDAEKNPFVEPILLSSSDSAKYDAALSAIPEHVFVIDVDANDKALVQPSLPQKQPFSVQSLKQSLSIQPSLPKALPLNRSSSTVGLTSFSKEDLNQMVPCGHFCKNKRK